MATTACNTPLTAERLRAALRYEPETGRFYRLGPIMGRARAGEPAGRTDERGYRYIRVYRRRYIAHRLAWLYVHGQWPSRDLDHINRDRSDNRISNLRECDNSHNQANQSGIRRNVSGLRGVSWDRLVGKWTARIAKDGVTHRLGVFVDKHQAFAAYVAKGKELFGEFFSA